jgi:enolase-phosphatase E1
VILLDIEGTTTPIAFVAGILFPYARTHLPLYLTQHADTPESRRILASLRAEYDHDAEARRQLPDWSPWPYLAWLMDRDRKSAALKELQGFVWEEGYRDGTLVGELFPDVAAALSLWRDAAIQVGIYSSGSVRAQQWLFRCSTAGDLTPLLSWHFDTTVGAKRNAASYTRIAADVCLPPGGILFVSDVAAELDAARQAGMATALIVRPGNAAQPDSCHRVISSLLDLRP